MSKKHLCISFLVAALLPWLLFSESLHDNVSRLISRAGSIFSGNNVESLAAQSQIDLIKIKGGSFNFGKFDTEFGDQRYAQQIFNYVLEPREVSIDDFAIAKYQITYSDYAIYTQANAKEPIEVTDIKQKELKEERVPVQLTWQEAQSYCQWLGKISGKKMDLPTEQQWEYAARNRGQFILYPTDSGIVEPGRNVPQDTDKERTDSVLQYKMMPVGMFPPNPLGIYDLASNGWEWTRDVYKEWTNNDKYKDDRVVRSQSIGESGGAPTVSRIRDNKNDRNTARCVMTP
ncbi:MAG: formylglycine-generating enzyme family protein [Hafnia sp.]|uniref:formylglycine-generating enzyme family protein n=1 Tax=Hafnia sp. TaxID=1873498 RepID=UPI002FC7F1AE